MHKGNIFPIGFFLFRRRTDSVETTRLLTPQHNIVFSLYLPFRRCNKHLKNHSHQQVVQCTFIYIHICRWWFLFTRIGLNTYDFQYTYLLTSVFSSINQEQNKPFSSLYQTKPSLLYRCA